MPAFVTHDPLNRDFTVTSNSAADIGSYTILVKYTISVPDDASKTTFTDWVLYDEFILIV